MPPNRTQTAQSPSYTPLHRILERGRFSDTTRRKYRNVIDQFVRVAGPDPKGWTRGAMDAFRSGLIARGMKPESIETYLASLHYVSKWWAADHGGIDFAVIQPIDLPGGLAQPRRALTETEAEKLLLACVDGKLDLYALRDLVLIVVDLETGIRVTGLSEMAFDKMGVSPFNYPIATIPIKSRGGKKKFPVPLSDLAVLAIETWHHALGTPARGPVFRRLLKHDRDGETIVKPTARGLSTTSLYEIIVKRAQKAGIGHVHPHTLRHTFVTWRIEANVPPIQIAAITGHKVSTIIEGDDYGEIETYINKDKLGVVARKHTPPWLSSLVRKLLRGF